MSDVGVWMRPEVLAHKLEARHQAKPMQAWNMGRWPSQLSRLGEHRLFVASEGAWRGYFKLCDQALYSPEDPTSPFTLLFDAHTWTPIEAIPVKRFRGFTYHVPPVSDDACISSNALPPHRG